MNDATENATSKRSSWLAALLSFLMPGVGQVYCGRLARGLIFALIYGLAIPVTFGLLAYFGPTPSVMFGLLAMAATLGVVMAAAVDAYRLAVTTRPDYGLKAYNHPAVYLLIGLMIQGSSIGYSLHVRATLFEAFRVPSISMFPSIAVNDRILGDKAAYRRANPQYGDIILFHPPADDWRNNYIKRIVALGGDTVEIKGGDVYVNGQKLPRELIASDVTTVDSAGKRIEGRIYRERNARAGYEVFVTGTGPGSGSDFGQITVPKYHCFVLGDNRDNSLDSRDFGCVPYGLIKGRVDYLYWPAQGWSRFGRLE